MTAKKERVKTIIVSGLIITAITWTADVIADVFIDNDGDLMTNLFSPGLNESAERLALIIIIIGIVGYFLELSKNHRKLIVSNDELQTAVDEQKKIGKTIKKLKSLLPTCPTCYSILDETGSWHELDIYLKEFPEAIYAEGYCPGCRKKMDSENPA